MHLTPITLTVGSQTKTIPVPCVIDLSTTEESLAILPEDTGNYRAGLYVKPNTLWIPVVSAVNLSLLLVSYDLRVLVNLTSSQTFAPPNLVYSSGVLVSSGVAGADGRIYLVATPKVPAQAVVSTTAIAASRTALAADSGGTFELASGVTYTLSSTVTLPEGVTLMGPATGTATIAVSGAATMNGATTSITITAGQVYAAIPRATNPAAFVVKGS